MCKKVQMKRLILAMCKKVQMEWGLEMIIELYSYKNISFSSNREREFFSLEVKIVTWEKSGASIFHECEPRVYP